jgi:hypothetical protein
MHKNLYFLREQHLQFLKSYIRILLFSDFLQVSIDSSMSTIA